ncbi:hypothetical protein VaNZ11_011930 [Volvox africanus]|uniref:Protein kinase domain-containing protein n=1 Tax=Volvox africanus TaxID=51714 RepID=A0ABQ5SE53_9CHLO|nr:hypothetical protein VaNZ11_011930 [Volvox africanus]
MLRCLCSPCMGRSGLKSFDAAELTEQPGGNVPVTAAAASNSTLAGTGSASIYAGDVTQTIFLGPVTGTGLALGPSLPSSDTVYVPICSPFLKSRSIKATDTEDGSPTRKTDGEPSDLPPGSALSSPSRSGPNAQASADGFRPNISPRACNSIPAFHSQPASIYSSCDQQPPSQSKPQQASLTGDVSISTLSLQPSALLPGQLFLIQQATSSSQSGGCVTSTNASLPLLPSNITCNAAHLSTGTSVRSEAATETTLRLPRELSGAPPPVALLGSEASTTRLVECSTYESVDTPVRTSSASPTVNGSNIVRPIATMVPASCGPVGSCAFGGASRKVSHVRGGTPPAGGPSPTFSLFGALQAFVEQRHAGDAAPTAGAGSPAGAAAQAQVQVQGDHFHGFDRGALCTDSQDMPTATLSRVRSVLTPCGRPTGESSHSRWPMVSEGDDSGPAPQNATGARRGNGSGSKWPQTSRGSATGLNAGHDVEEGIVIGGLNIESTNSNSNMAVGAPSADHRVGGLFAAAVSGRTSRTSTLGEDVLGIFSCGRPLSRPHSFDGMASFLSAANNTYLMDDNYKVSTGQSGALIGCTGSDTDGSRTDNAISVVSGGGGLRSGGGAQRGGGGNGSRAMRMQQKAERREFLSAARSINAVLQDVQILSLLGAGAHGKVYKGALKDRFVAVKVIIHDTDVRSAIPVSSLTGIRHVPSSTSLANGGATGINSGPMPGSALECDLPTSKTASGAPAPSAGALTAFTRAGLDASYGSGSDVMLPGGPGVAGISLGSIRRGASSSGTRPAEHLLRYQRAGSSSLHTLPLVLPGGGDSGSQGAGAPTLPVLSLPGMTPVVMPHKHMLEGLISASAQHPNIVETYRIVTQLLSAPSMPAFVVTRGSQTPLWETTNFAPAAFLKLGNGSVGGGLRKVSRAGSTSGSAAAAAGNAFGTGPGATHDRLQGISSIPSAWPTSQAGLDTDAVKGPSTIGPTSSFPGITGQSTAAIVEANASPPKRRLSNPVPATEPEGSCAAELTAWDLPKLDPGATSTCLDNARSSSDMADSRAGTPAQRPASSGCPEESGSAKGLRCKEADKEILPLEGAPADVREQALPGVVKLETAPKGDNLLSSDDTRIGLSCAVATAGTTGAVNAAPSSICASTLRENSTLSVSALVRDGVSSGPVSGPGRLLAVADGSTSTAPQRSSGHGSVGTAHTQSSSGSSIDVGGVPPGVAQPERTSIDVGSRSSCLSTGVAVVSASGLAQGEPETYYSGDMIPSQPTGEGYGTTEGHGSVNAGSLSQPLGVERQQESGEKSPGRQGGGVRVESEVAAQAAGNNRGDPVTERSSADGTGSQDVDSAELILDMLGAQAAAQRTASFLRRQQQQQQQQQQAALDVRGGASPQFLQCAQGARPAALNPDQMEAAPWCVPFDGQEAEDIVGLMRHMATSRRNASGLGATTAAGSKASGGTNEVPSGSVQSSNLGGDSPSGDLPAAGYDYMVADDSSLMLHRVETFGLSTALFSTFRNSYAPTDHGSVSDRPPYRPLQYLRGSQPSTGSGAAFSVPGSLRGQAGTGVGLVGGVGGDYAGTESSATGMNPPYGISAQQAKQHEPSLHVESAASLGSAHAMEASLALPPPLQLALPSVPPPSLHNPSVAGNGLGPSAAWLPTIDELTAGVGADPLQQSMSGTALTAGRSSTGSTARNLLLHTGSLGWGEQGGDAGVAGDSVGAGTATRTSNSSGGSLLSGTGIASQNRSVLGPNPASTYGGQLMPAELHYGKLSWSNHTHTTGSTSATAILNSGFTALLSSNNTTMTGGGSNPGAGGAGGGGNLVGSGMGSWRRGDSTGVAGVSGFRRTTNVANTAGGTDTLIVNHGETAAVTAATTTKNGTDIVHGGGIGSGAGPQGSLHSHTRNGGGSEMRPHAMVELQSRSSTDPHSSRSASGARRRAAATAKVAWGRNAPGRERWQVLIVQEMCTRGNLRDAISSGAFHSSNASAGTQVIAMQQMLDTAAEIASAMSYLHNRAIVHGDLKTANVLLQRQDSDPRGFVAKLADFGLARQMGARGAEDGLLVSRIGTVTHMAPETIRDNMVLLASDVYSFGVILWELYCAKQPFANYSAFQLLSAVVQYDERPQFPSHCPPAYAALAIRCMARDPQQRPTFAQVHKELICIRDELFGVSSSGSHFIQGLAGTLTVPLAQAHKEAKPDLQGRLQAVAVANLSGDSGHGSGTLRGEVAQDSETTSGPLRELGMQDSVAPQSSESWDVYGRRGDGIVDRETMVS